ncbi:MAG TPA: RNA methyltransferase, partial [Pelolinea sp.]|nr:RNA methyltransferase [Pelolinea sp.]
QGIALETSGYSYADLTELFSLAEKRGEKLFLLLLDQVQDPQNFGTLIRSAELFGVHGILIPSSRAAGVTPAVVNASSGGSEHLLIAQGNLAQAIDLIKTRDAWVVGLDMDSETQSISECDLTGNLAIVVGSEGGGLRRLVRDQCDIIAHIPTRGKLDSLNAAVAGSIALYTAHSQRK